MTNFIDFDFDHNYTVDTSFTRVKYGANRSILEVELNEMQKIQEENRASVIRRMVPSGFVYLKREDIKGDEIVLNHDNTPYSVSLAPSKLILNGYEATIEGSTTIGSDDGYFTIQLPTSPTFDTRDDLIFLEFWFEEMTGQSAIKKYGYEHGEILQNKLVDERIAEETSRRVALRWRVRVSEKVNFAKWENGFGYENAMSFSPIYARGSKSTPVEKEEFIFRKSSDNAFKGQTFYNDNGLWVAGKKSNSSNTDLGIVDNYVFAIPLLKVSRRNSGEYSINNPFGAPTWVDNTSISNHPNRVFHNMLELSDVEDLRKTISFKELNHNVLVNKSLKSLISGNLETKHTESMHRAQFGVTPIDIKTNGLLLLNRFNGSIDPEKTNGNTLLTGSEAKFGLGVSGEALIMDGTNYTEYGVPDFSKDLGTIEFFFKPFWGSEDINIDQSIFKIVDTSVSADAFDFRKVGSELIFKVVQDNTGSEGSYYYTKIDLNEINIQSKRFHHFKIIWDSISSSLRIHINGKLVKQDQYNSTSLSPTKLKIGNIESFSTDLSIKESLIEELAVYNNAIHSSKQITRDVVDGKATIYPSFNGYFNSFIDNEHVQKDFVKEITTVNGSNSFNLLAPYGSLIGTTTPVVYNKDGLKYKGVWSGLGTNKAAFTLSEAPGSTSTNLITTFSGEKVYVQHNFLIQAGNGIIEMPTKVLEAEFNGVKASFNKKDEDRREIVLDNPRVTLNNTDRAYDYNTTRSNNQAFSRLVYYYIQGNNQDRYYIPETLYGREVLGIRAVNKAYDGIKKFNESDVNYDPNKKFEIELASVLTDTEHIEVEVDLGGLTFDYNTHSKSLVSNTLKTVKFKVVSTGTEEKYTFKLDTINGYNTFVSSQTIFRKSTSTTSEHFAVFKNNVLVDLKSVDGFGTPFLNIIFDSTPLLNDVIEVYALASYSPKNNDQFSIWYNHVPYQGVLGNTTKKLNNLTEWKTFVTTLSSGKVLNSNVGDRSLVNAFNRLPGGASYSHLLTSEEINLVNDSFTGNYSGTSVNKYFIISDSHRSLISSTINQIDNLFMELDNEIIVSKEQLGQNGKISAVFSNNGFYLPDTMTSIHKYAGAYCLVVDENGELLLFIFGNTHGFTSTTHTVAKAFYGDLFRIPGRPMIKLNN